MPKSWVEAIAERESQLGADAVARMATDFAENAKVRLAAIDAALTRHSLAEVRQATHGLAASAGSLCFHHLRVAAQDVEHACDTDDCAGLPALAAMLAPLVEMAMIQLRARYGLT